MSANKSLGANLLVLLMIGLFPLIVRAASFSPASRRMSSSDQQYVSEPVAPLLSRPVSALPRPAVLFQAVFPGRIARLPSQDVLNPLASDDPLLALHLQNNSQSPAPERTFEGISNLSMLTPPDPNGDVGLAHYVQMVNVYFSVYDKKGSQLVAPTWLPELFAELPVCGVSDRGDPIVLYDAQADRWLLSQIASSASADYICVAISQTGDPTGSFYLYEFEMLDFPDYFKFGVWPDAQSNAYLMTASESPYTAYAFDRQKMLAGEQASFVRFTGQTNFLLPADVDGAAPPLGAPGYFYTFKDNYAHGGIDRLEIFALDVDWDTPEAAAFSQIASLPISTYSYTVCGAFQMRCIPQKGTFQKLDAVSEWPMHRLVYRNFGDHETLAGNFTVDVGGDRAGIRWFELRKTDADWFLYQEGTYAPSSEHFWMGSLALDRQGNMALGYSASSLTSFPDIRYATRLAGDPLGSFGSEVILMDGGGSQTGSNRWGDYSAMSVDPVDDCTFWYTNEYYPISSSNGWHTRIGQFVLPGCRPVEADFALRKSAQVAQALPGQLLPYTIEVANLGPDDLISSTISTRLVMTDTLPTGSSFHALSAPSNWVCEADSLWVTCSTDSLPAGITDTLLLTLTMPITPQVVVNTAVLSDLEGIDFNLANQTSSAKVVVDTTPVVLEADLALRKSAQVVQALPGQLLPYTIEVANLGPDDLISSTISTRLVMTDTLPAGSSFHAFSAPSNWVCEAGSSFVTCSTGSLPVGITDTLLLTLTMPITPQVVVNTAILSDLEGIDFNLANQTSSATVVVDTAPVANGDCYTTTENIPLNVLAPGVLLNDTDSDFPAPLLALTATLLTDPANGTVTLGSDGAFQYTPAAYFSGQDSFIYQVSDGLLSANATVWISVTMNTLVNHAPQVSLIGDVTLYEGQVFSQTGSFTDWDSTNWQAEVNYGDGSGIYPLVLPAEKTFWLGHAYLQNGVYPVTVTISDGLDAGANAISVTVLNAAPLLAALPDQTVISGQSVTITGVLTDAGVLDEHVAEIEWSPGITTSVHLAAGVTEFVMSHVYSVTKNIIVSVSVRVMDGDGAQNVRTLTITIIRPKNLLFAPFIFRSP